MSNHSMRYVLHVFRKGYLKDDGTYEPSNYRAAKHFPTSQAAREYAAKNGMKDTKVESY